VIAPRRTCARPCPGRLRLDRAKIAAEERLDGKFLLSTSDPDLSAEDVALGYKNLLEAERGFRDLKTTLELRPVFHRLEHRIRAHVLLSWLALLLIGVAERQTGQTWRRIALDLGRLHQNHPHRTRRHRPADHRAHPSAARDLHRDRDRAAAPPHGPTTHRLTAPPAPRAARARRGVGTQTQASQSPVSPEPIGDSAASACPPTAELRPAPAHSSAVSSSATPPGSCCGSCPSAAPAP
jgi:hypothetical protein